jgi:hypothetical protein
MSTKDFFLLFLACAVDLHFGWMISVCPLDFCPKAGAELWAGRGSGMKLPLAGQNWSMRDSTTECRLTSEALPAKLSLH